MDILVLNYSGTTGAHSTGNGTLRSTQMPVGVIPRKSNGPQQLKSRTRRKRPPAVSGTTASSTRAGIGGQSISPRCRLRNVYCCTLVLSTIAPRCGSMALWPARMKADTHRSRSICRHWSTRAGSLSSSAPKMIPPTWRSREGNRIGSSNRIPSGIRERRASGRPSGSKTVPSTWIERIRWTPNLERWEIGFEAWLGGTRRETLKLGVKLRVGNVLLADDTYTVVAGEVHRRIALSDPGIDDYRNGLLWNPATPTLIDVQLQLWADRGELLDEVTSYTALRSINVAAIASCSTGGRTLCAWCSIRATGRKAG